VSVAVDAPETPAAASSATSRHAPAPSSNHCHWKRSAEPSPAVPPPVMFATTENAADPCGASAATDCGCPFAAMLNDGTATVSVTTPVVADRPNLSLTTNR